MKKPYIVKGSPVVPSLCAICMAVLWYLYFYYISVAEDSYYAYAMESGWRSGMFQMDFESMEPFAIVIRILQLVIPIVLFVGVLFLAEHDLRWMAIPLLLPVAHQVALFIYDLIQNGVGGTSEGYLFAYPMAFCVPFLVAILFLLTVTGVIPTKIPALAMCALAAVVPVVLTFCGVGEFVMNDAENGIVVYYWSDVISFALQYVAIGALIVKMRKPRPEDFVTMEELQAAYNEKMAAQADAALPVAEKRAKISAFAEEKGVTDAFAPFLDAAGESNYRLDRLMKLCDEIKDATPDQAIIVLENITPETLFISLNPQQKEEPAEAPDDGENLSEADKVEENALDEED